MARTRTDHDQYVAKVNHLVAAGRDDLIEELVLDYRRAQLSGRESFWATATPGWPARRQR